MVLATAFFVLLLGVFAECPFKSMHKGMDLGTQWEGVSIPPTVGTTTVHGCTCKEACGATVEDGFNCDWCYTENNCGHYSVTRLAYYDYCVYPTQSSYEVHDWKWKHNFLWEYLSKNQTSGEYINKFNVVSESVQTTFDTQWDWMPAGRHKVIHSVGAVCQVDLDISSTKYTGILQKGTATGYFRFGSATDPVSEGVAPGAGFKFLRTGVKSANWVMLDDPNNTDGKDFNLWDRNLTNHVSAFTLSQQPVVVKFEQVSNCVTKVGLSNLAAFTQDGEAILKPTFPWELAMVPTGNAAMSSESTDLASWMKRLIASMPKGTTIYDVMAMEGPFASWEKIGSLTVKEDCITSQYGDNNMYFRHQRIEEDWTIRQDWYTEAHDLITATCGTTQSTLTPPYKCSEEEMSLDKRCSMN